MSSQRKILAVDDEHHILELIEYNLRKNNLDVIKADSGERAIEILDVEQRPVDLVLLDVMLSGIDGLEVLKFIRGNDKLKDIPVIMLTAKSDEFSKVIGLELGADDYLAKPFGVHELVARIKAVLRRTTKQAAEKKTALDEEISVGQITINKQSRVVKVNNEPIVLALKEFELLYLLAQNKGIVFTRDQLLEKIWGYDFSGETRTVDVHIRNLRKKIEQDDNNPKYIKTVRGVGYKFDYLET